MSTTLVTCFSSGLAALHALRNIAPNHEAISNILSEIRCFLARLVSVGLGLGQLAVSTGWMHCEHIMQNVCSGSDGASKDDHSCWLRC